MKPASGLDGYRYRIDAPPDHLERAELNDRCSDSTTGLISFISVYINKISSCDEPCPVNPPVRKASIEPHTQADRALFCERTLITIQDGIKYVIVEHFGASSLH